jgi:hypothetical protein
MRSKSVRSRAKCRTALQMIASIPPSAHGRAMQRPLPDVVERQRRRELRRHRSHRCDRRGILDYVRCTRRYCPAIVTTILQADRVCPALAVNT